MFSNAVVDTDIFLDMPLTTQALYFHLGMHTDDEGFVNAPQKIVRSLGCQPDDFKLLVAKGFVLCFDNGVIVITHFHQNNTLRKDRTTPTLYSEQRALLCIEHNRYELIDSPVTTTCQPNDNQMATKCPHNITKLNSNKDNTHMSANADESALNYQEIVSLFNQLCVSLPRVEKLTANRKQRIKAADRELHGDFSSFFQKIEESDFLTGRTGNWSGCSFDWCLKPSNIIKIVEGNYSNKPQSANTGQGYYIDYGMGDD